MKDRTEQLNDIFNNLKKIINESIIVHPVADRKANLESATSVMQNKGFILEDIQKVHVQHILNIIQKLQKTINDDKKIITSNDYAPLYLIRMNLKIVTDICHKNANPIPTDNLNKLFMQVEKAIHLIESNQNQQTVAAHNRLQEYLNDPQKAEAFLANANKPSRAGMTDPIYWQAIILYHYRNDGEFIEKVAGASIGVVAEKDNYFKNLAKSDPYAAACILSQRNLAMDLTDQDISEIFSKHFKDTKHSEKKEDKEKNPFFRSPHKIDALLSQINTSMQKLTVKSFDDSNLNLIRPEKTKKLPIKLAQTRPPALHLTEAEFKKLLTDSSQAQSYLQKIKDTELFRGKTAYYLARLAIRNYQVELLPLLKNLAKSDIHAASFILKNSLVPLEFDFVVELISQYYGCKHGFENHQSINEMITNIHGQYNEPCMSYLLKYKETLESFKSNPLLANQIIQLSDSQLKALLNDHSKLTEYFNGLIKTSESMDTESTMFLSFDPKLAAALGKEIYEYRHNPTLSEPFTSAKAEPLLFKLAMANEEVAALFLTCRYGLNCMSKEHVAEIISHYYPGQYINEKFPSLKFLIKRITEISPVEKFYLSREIAQKITGEEAKSESTVETATKGNRKIPIKPTTYFALQKLAQEQQKLEIISATTARINKEIFNIKHLIEDIKKTSSNKKQYLAEETLQKLANEEAKSAKISAILARNPALVMEATMQQELEAEELINSLKEAFPTFESIPQTTGELASQINSSTLSSPGSDLSSLSSSPTSAKQMLTHPLASSRSSSPLTNELLSLSSPETNSPRSYDSDSDSDNPLHNSLPPSVKAKSLPSNTPFQRGALPKKTSELSTSSQSFFLNGRSKTEVMQISSSETSKNPESTSPPKSPPSSFQPASPSILAINHGFPTENIPISRRPTRGGGCNHT